MKTKLFFVAAASIALASCSSEDVVELNNGNAIDFRVAMGSEATSRGTETTTGNLKEFNVTALNGAANYFTDVTFKKADGETNFKSDKDYLWPGSDVLNFYAYSPTTISGVSINATAQTVTDFTPAAAIKDQVDFITAYASSSKIDAGVALTFKHTLSQIQIKALTNSVVYKFEVKGAKIATVNSKGSLDMNEGGISWTFDATPEKAIYDVTYDNAIVLNGTAQDVSATGDNGLAMLLPQQLVKWDNEKDAKNENNGAFLAVLLKITTLETNTQVYPKEVGEFAWACVPVDTKWEAGKRYTYILDFSKGAGQVPPTDPDEPGEDILGGPISFTAEVSEWVNADNNIDMDYSGNNAGTEAGNE